MQFTTNFITGFRSEGFLIHNEISNQVGDDVLFNDGTPSQAEGDFF